MPLLLFFAEMYREEDIMVISRDGYEPEIELNDLCDKREHSSAYRIDNIYYNNLDNTNGIDLTINEYVKVQCVNFDIVYHEFYDSFKM